MAYGKRVVPLLALAGLLALPVVAGAQSRGRAVPRAAIRAGRPSTVIVARPFRPYYIRPYRPGIAFGLYGYPWYGSYGYGYPWYGYPGYGYGGYYGTFPRYGMRSYGGVRIDLPQRDAEVYVDGYYTGVVNDFDGAFQQINLEPGPHRIEVRAEGFEPVSFDVRVEPGRTITYRAALREARP
jgi:hypothetical protein